MDDKQADQATPQQPIEETVAAVSGKFSGLRKDLKGWIVLILAVVAVIAFFGSAFGGGIGLWSWQAGLGFLRWTLGIALIAIVIGIIGIFLDRRKNRKTNWLKLGLGMIVAVGFLGYVGSYIVTARSLPAIHDITTDLADPPKFTHVKLREDNWDQIPGADDDDMRGMNPRQRWATLHQEAFPDIRSVRIDQPVAAVVEKARRLAEDRGWEIVNVDPASGNLEATDTVSLFRFKDDVVIRARAAENGAASIIDMRSVSRVGVHDLGVNSKRVQAFLSDLSGTTTAAQ